MDKTWRVGWICLLWALRAVGGESLGFGADHAVRTATFEFYAPEKVSRFKALVGTAFAIGPNEFVTTAHLLDTTIGGRFGRPVLVDSHGVEYRVADILRYSDRQDYVVFSLERPPRVRPLSVGRNESSVSDLYIAGWHPDGDIFIRHGLLAGITPAEDSGESDWLRFSGPVWGAAAGGPVVNGSGEVIGIVQGVARNGGANYATPVTRIFAAKADAAQIHGAELLRNLQPAVSVAEPLAAEVPLPMSFDDFSNEVVRLRVAYFDRIIGPLLAATRHNFVLSGSEAAETCSLLNGKNCACKRRSDANGVLVLKDTQTAGSERVANTHDRSGQSIAGVVLARAAKDNPADADPVSDPSFHLRLAVERSTGATPAPQGAAELKSWAAVSNDRLYIDFHGRTWRERTWSLLDRDLEAVSLVREAADGYVVVTRTVPTGLDYAADLQLKFIANLIYYECEDLSGEGAALMAATR